MSWTFQGLDSCQGQVFFLFSKTSSVLFNISRGGGGELGHENDKLPQLDAMAHSEWISSLPLMCIHAAHKDRALLAYTRIYQASFFSSLGHVCSFMLLIIVEYIVC